MSVQRSFTLSGSTLEERDDWVSALNSAIDENALKRNTFEAVRAGTQVGSNVRMRLCLKIAWKTPKQWGYMRESLSFLINGKQVNSFSAEDIDMYTFIKCFKEMFPSNISH